MSISEALIGVGVALAIIVAIVLIAAIFTIPSSKSKQNRRDDYKQYVPVVDHNMWHGGGS